MAYIHLTYAGISSANQVLWKAIREISRMEDAFGALDGRIVPEIQSRGQIGERLRGCRRSAEAIGQAVGGILEVAESGVLAYRAVEARLRRTFPMDVKLFEMR